MGYIPQEVITQVLDRCDIVDVVSSYIPLKKTGRNFRALSPFRHEKTPSFFVNPDKQIFHCFSSGKGGNVITFVMEHEHLDFPSAIHLLAERANIEITPETPDLKRKKEFRQVIYDINQAAYEYFHRNLVVDRSRESGMAREYLKGRGIDLSTVKNFNLGFALNKWESLIKVLRDKGFSLKQIEQAGLALPQSQGEGFYDRFRNRIMFPIFDIRNRCVAFGARTMEPDNPAKYINSPETPVYTKGHHLYGLSLAKDAIGQKDYVVVVEGYFDFIVPYQAGFQNIVASLGTALTPDQIRLVRRYTRNVVMLFDSDQAGEAAMLRSLDALIEDDMNVKVASLGDGEDPDSFIRKHDAQAFEQRVLRAQTVFEYKLNALCARYDRNSVEGRAEICADMLPTIDKFKNEIVKSEYLRQLAQSLAISEIALGKELEKMNAKPNRYQNTASDEPSLEVRDEAIRPVERDLLRLMLEDGKFVKLTKSEIEINDLQSQKVRRIVQKIFELSDHNPEVAPSLVMSSMEDQSLVKVISGLLADDSGLIGDKQRIHRDCISRLKKERLQQKRRMILKEMELAKETGNQDRLDELTRQFNQLIKR